MNVTAKMQVTRKAKVEHGWNSVTESVEVTLNAIYSSDKSDPNYSYSQATPSAELKMEISNPLAAEFFKSGKKYLVTFTEAE